MTCSLFLVKDTDGLRIPQHNQESLSRAHSGQRYLRSTRVDPELTINKRAMRRVIVISPFSDAVPEKTAIAVPERNLKQ